MKSQDIARLKAGMREIEALASRQPAPDAAEVAALTAKILGRILSDWEQAERRIEADWARIGRGIVR